MKYWSTQSVLKQVAAELGLGSGIALPSDDLKVNQLLAWLNSAGNELLLYYPWSQLLKQWELPLVIGQDSYAVPDDCAYFVNQTQWDKNSGWPLLGPKTPQEWAFINARNFAGTRYRYRVLGNAFKLYPKPAVTSVLQMNYISSNWVGGTNSMTTSNGDELWYLPMLLTTFLKFKFYVLKGLDSTGAKDDFMRIFNSVTGKESGAPVLRMSGNIGMDYIGSQSVPDNSWNI